MNYRHYWLFAVLLVFAACSDEPASPVSETDSQLHKSSLESNESTVDVKDRYVIVFKESVRDIERAVDEMTRGNGVAVHYRYRHALKGFNATIPPQAVEAIRRNPNVAYVEPDGVAHKTQQSNPPSWGLDRIDQRALPLNSTYNYQNNGAGVRVYIIDTGIRFDHQEYNGRAFSGYDFVDNDANAYDCDGHGTHVAGTVAGNTVGVAKGATLIAVRVLDCNGSGSWGGVIAGIDWVTGNHVKPAVANMSLGGGYYAPINTAVANSVAAGVVYAVSAGNSNANACNYSPASTPSALTVGASTSGDVRSSFSNFGSCVDIFAPGSSIYSSTMTSTNTYESWNGTSMASPHVAGVAALFLSSNPNATPAQVETAIKSNATLNVLSSVGTGSPNSLLYSLIAGPVTPPPTAPSNLTVGNATTSSLTLNWSDNSNDESNFRIERASASNGPWNLVANVGANVTSYVNTGLSSNTTFYYRVFSFNGNGTSSPSNTASGATLPNTTTGTMRVAALNGYPTGNSNAWYGNLAVTVHDGNNAPLSGVTVSVTWGSGSGSATTNSSGVATITSPRLKRSNSSITMSVSNLVKSGYTYTSSANTPNPPSALILRP